jgi:hypothetical protein
LIAPQFNRASAAKASARLSTGAMHGANPHWVRAAGTYFGTRHRLRAEGRVHRRPPLRHNAKPASSWQSGCVVISVTPDGHSPNRAGRRTRTRTQHTGQAWGPRSGRTCAASKQSCPVWQYLGGNSDRRPRASTSRIRGLHRIRSPPMSGQCTIRGGEGTSSAAAALLVQSTIASKGRPPQPDVRVNTSRQPPPSGQPPCMHHTRSTEHAAWSLYGRTPSLVGTHRAKL